MTMLAPKPGPPSHPAVLARDDAPLYAKLAAGGRPYVADDDKRVTRWSEHANAVRAVLRSERGHRPGVALFTGSNGPIAVLDLAAAERLADQLDQILAAYEEAAHARS